MLRTLRIIVACTFSCSLIHAGRISFRAPQTLSLGSVSAETFGDFHKNGRQDLMVVSFGAGLQLYPNVGYGRFGTPAAILPVLTGFTPRVVAADFNQDGKLDVALLTVGEQNAATVTVLLGNGDGTLQAPTVYATGTLSGGGALLAGDFNRDGHLDLAVGGDSIQVLEGKGDGTFTGPVETPLGGATVSSMTAADFNRDGKLDLAVCASVNLTAYSLSIYTGKGAGTFQPPASAIASGPTAVASGDLNGDGLADLAAADPNNGGSVQVFLANGDGTFQLPANYPLATGHDLLNGEGAIYVVDANQDGHLDIVNGTYLFPGAIDGGLVTTFLGRGDGTFQPGVTSLKGEEVLTMAVADFNGDGYPDLAFAGELCCVSVAAGSGSGRFESSALYPVPEYARAVFAADFQGAGQIDLALLTPPHLDLYPGTAKWDVWRSARIYSDCRIWRSGGFQWGRRSRSGGYWEQSETNASILRYQECEFFTRAHRQFEFTGSFHSLGGREWRRGSGYSAEHHVFARHAGRYSGSARRWQGELQSERNDPGYRCELRTNRGRGL